MDQATGLKSGSMGFLQHHLYEYRKGVRHLFMMTMNHRDSLLVQKRLQQEEIDFHLHQVSDDKINIFFGRAPCVATARKLITKPLSHLTPEEDFILGTLLGYDREQQCLRFLAMSKAGRPVVIPQAAWA